MQSVESRELAELEEICTLLQADLEVKKRDAEGAEEVCSGLEAEVGCLRDELRSQAQAHREALDAWNARLEVERQEEDERARLHSAGAVATAVAAAVALAEEVAARAAAAARSELAEVCRMHETEVRRLQCEVDEAVAAAAAAECQREQAETGQQSSSVVDRLHAELQAEQAAHARDVAALTTQLEAERQKLDTALNAHAQAQAAANAAANTDATSAGGSAKSGQDKDDKRLRDELARQRDAMQRAADEQIAALEQKHGEDLESVRQAVVEAQAAHASVLAGSMADAEEKLKAAVAVERKQGKAALAVALEEQRVRLEATLSMTKGGTTESISALTDTISSMKDNIEALSDVVREGERLLLEEKADRVRSDERHAAELLRIRRECEGQVGQERVEGQKELAAVREQAAADLAQIHRELKSDHQAEIERHEGRLKEAALEYQTLEAKWRGRGGRPEDATRIHQLEREVAEKDDLLARTREETNYFKRELLSREESSGLTQFARQQPQAGNLQSTSGAGVMQVIKSKREGDSGKGANGPLRILPGSTVSGNGPPASVRGLL